MDQNPPSTTPEDKKKLDQLKGEIDKLGEKAKQEIADNPLNIEAMKPTPQPVQQVQPPVQETPGQTPQSTPTDSPKEKKPILLILAGILTLLLAAGVYYYFFVNNTSNEEVNPINYETPEPKTTKSYEGDFFKFEYPSDYTLREDTEKIILSFVGSTQTTGTELFDGVSLSIVVKEAGDKTLAEFLEDEMSLVDTNVATISAGPDATKVGDYNGFTYVVKSLGEFTTYVFESADEMYLVSVTTNVADAQNLGYQSQVDEILASFEFNSLGDTTESTASPSSTPAY